MLECLISYGSFDVEPFLCHLLGANEENAGVINVPAAAAVGQQCSSLCKHHHISKRCQALARRVCFNAENSQEEHTKTICQTQIHDRLTSAHLTEEDREKDRRRKGGRRIWWAYIIIIIWWQWGCKKNWEYGAHTCADRRVIKRKPKPLHSLSSPLDVLVKLERWLSTNEVFIGACKSFHHRTII